MPDVPSSKAPGPTAIPRKSVATCNCAWRSSPKPSRTSAGRRKCGSANAIDKLSARGKHANQVVVAIARELVAFMWAIAKEVPVTPVECLNRP